MPPNKGVYRGKAHETIDVQVHSEELRVVPPELAAERLQSLSIPTFPGKQPRDIDQVNQQQEQQQQGWRMRFGNADLISKCGSTA